MDYKLLLKVVNKRNALLVGGSAATLYAMMRLCKESAKEYGLMERIVCWLRELVMTHLGVSYGDQFRRAFQNRFVAVEYKSPKGHSHGIAAGLRTAAQKSIMDFIEVEGYEPYVISMSARDKMYDGYHQVYMSKDVVHPSKSDPVHDRHVLVSIDADYYANVPQWLRYGRPALFYTFTPTQVGGVIDDGCFCIREDEVTYRVNGGGSYHHKIWDYSRDSLRVDYLTGSWFCSVETKEMSKQRSVVCITPHTWVWTPIARFIPGENLVRRRFEKSPGINRSDYLTTSGEHRVSVGKPGLWHAVDTSLATYEAIRVRMKVASKPDIQTVEKLLRMEKGRVEDNNLANDAALLYDCIRQDECIGPVPFTAGGHPDSYQCSGHPKNGYLVTEDGMRCGREVAPPLCTNAAVVPVVSLNNDIACIEGRVNQVRNDTEPLQKFASYAAEFAQFVVPKRLMKTGVPISIEEVIEIQSKPTQRARSEQVHNLTTTPDGVPITVKAFMKKEAYGGVNHPRNISTVPTSHTLTYSSYTYAFKRQILYDAKWYAPGLQPEEIAHRVVDICQQYGLVSETDYSRFDGTISKWLKVHVERAIYKRWVASDHSDELGRLMSSEDNPPAITRNGYRYKPGYGRLSGSPTTTDGNTLINAYVSYAANRLAGSTAAEAYERLGLYAGDDGVTPITGHFMEAAASALGLKLKCVECTPGSAVNFLARRFPDPWSGGLGSVQDPLRCVRKLHITFAPVDVPIGVAAVNRAIGYLGLDPNAPIVSNWCRKVLELSDKKDLEGRERWIERCRVDLPYLNEGWPQIPNREDAVATVADAYGTDGATITSWCDAIDAAKSLDELRLIVDAPSIDKEDVATRNDSGLPTARLPTTKPPLERPSSSSAGSSSSGYGSKNRNYGRRVRPKKRTNQHRGSNSGD
ncbi:RNA-dependent RNA polymerase [Beihai shrimp virus 6]|uniref:RNA-dependent RNA polymerase n=1 Tax=Beihai shrimp virus 6 TaxID=1922672 RepID=UPI00090BD4E5|nr:RNA-dependent RNA polymerase [Beihai shrimp virus 6]APG76113.1 RNA-dependent RNA polymerase [Beihai shrimp virus 6]APG76156.1 RNA-dependent RNA polymerase [Beihai shrimp virus 6]